MDMATLSIDDKIKLLEDICISLSEDATDLCIEQYDKIIDATDELLLELD